MIRLAIYDQSPYGLEADQEREETFSVSAPGTYRLRTAYGTASDFDFYALVAVSEAFDVLSP